MSPTGVLMKHRPADLSVGEASTLPKLTVVTWTPQGQEQERALNTALGPALAIVHCHCEQELWDALEQLTVGVVVIGGGFSGRPTAASLVTVIKQRFPAIRIIGYGWLTRALAEDILGCARLGLHALALRGYCDINLLVRRILAEIEGAEEVVVRDIQEWLPPLMIALARVLVTRLRDAPTLAQLARAMGYSSRTLQRIAGQEHVCSPGVLVCAIRVLVAANLLAGRNVSMDEVLRRTGFPSARSLRAAMKRCGLPSPQVIYGAAGYAGARDAILRVISPRYREQASSVVVPPVVVDANPTGAASGGLRDIEHVRLAASTSAYGRPRR